MTPAPVEDDLWREFHRTVNMSAAELEAWHRRRVDRPTDVRGRRVLAVLRKRRAELTAEDAEVMRTVVQEVRTHAAEHRPGSDEPSTGQPGSLDQLRSIGHDPLLTGRRPVREVSPDQP